MKQIMNWMLAAILVCGTSVFTACSNQEDNPAQEQAKKNRKEFIQHTRATMEKLANNLNFASWEAANAFNLHFNQNVLNNSEFKDAVLIAFLQQALQTIKPVEEGSELAAMGYTMSGTLDLTKFNYRFTGNADNTSFNVEEADNFEIIISGWNPTTLQIEESLYKITLKAGGTSRQRIVSAPNLEGVAFEVIMPTEFQFALSSKISGVWNDDFSGILHHELPEGATDSSLGFTADATINSNILPGTYGSKADNTQMVLSMTTDKVNDKGSAQFSYLQNGYKLLEFSIKESGNGNGGISNLDLTKLTSSTSLFDVISVLVNSKKIDEGKLTLLNDLSLTISISDMQKCLLVAHESTAARRNSADQATMNQYAQQMNDIISCTMTCQGVNQTIPMRMQAQKLGIDWWMMPAFNFADENGYVPFTELLDKETIAYSINIVDHAAEPMKQSAIIVRQLLEFVLSFSSEFESAND